MGVMAGVLLSFCFFSPLSFTLPSAPPVRNADGLGSWESAEPSLTGGPLSGRRKTAMERERERERERKKERENMKKKTKPLISFPSCLSAGTPGRS